MVGTFILKKLILNLFETLSLKFMFKCNTQQYFVALSSFYDIIPGNRDKHVYPLNQDIILKSKNDRKKLINIDYHKKYDRALGPCKFIERNNNDEGLILRFTPYHTVRDDDDNIIKELPYLDKNIIKLILDDISNFDIIEELLKDACSKKLYINQTYEEDKYKMFYNTFLTAVPFFDKIPFKKLEEKNYLTPDTLALAIKTYNPSIYDIDKYMPKHLIPTKKNYLHIIEKQNSGQKFIYDLIELSFIDPRFGKFVVDNLELKKETEINLYAYMGTKYWRCFLDSGFIFKNLPEIFAENILKKNPCLVIFFENKFHTEDRYLNALKRDILCYEYLNKKNITSKVDNCYSDNVFTQYVPDDYEFRS